MSKAKINDYESVIILHPEINDDTKTEIIEKAKTFMSEVKKIDELGLKKLAYEVKKCNSGIYVVFYYKGTNRKNKNLDDFYKNNSKILKYIILKED